MSSLALSAPRRGWSTQEVGRALLLAAAAAVAGGLTGAMVMGTQAAIATALAVTVAGTVWAARHWQLEGFIVALFTASLLPLPALQVGINAQFPLAMFAVPAILVLGIRVTRARGQPVHMLHSTPYLLLFAVGLLSFISSWLFWDPRVPTGIARGYGHRWIGYQLIALYFLAVPWLTFNGGVLVSRLFRLHRLYALTFLSLAALSVYNLFTWLHDPVNPLDAFAAGQRADLEYHPAVYLVVMSTALFIHVRRPLLRTAAAVLFVCGCATAGVTYVLSGWLGAFAAVTVMLWRRYGTRGLLLWLAADTVIALAAQQLIGAIATQRALSPDADRLQLWHSALTVWGRSPVIGVGPGDLASYMETYAAFPLDLVLQGYQQAHNIFLEVLAEVGIVGTACLMVFLVLVVRDLVRPVRGDATAQFARTAGLGLLVASAVMAALGGGFIPTIASAGWNSMSMVLLVWLLAGVGVGAGGDDRRATTLEPAAGAA